MAYGEIQDLKNKIKEHTLNMNLLEMLLSVAIDRNIDISDRDMKFLSRTFCLEGLAKSSRERELKKIIEEKK